MPIDARTLPSPDLALSPFLASPTPPREVANDLLIDILASALPRDEGGQVWRESLRSDRLDRQERLKSLAAHPAIESRFGEAAVREMLSLSEENDPELFFEGLMTLGGRLEGNGNAIGAYVVYERILKAHISDLPAAFLQRLQNRLNVLQGRGDWASTLESTTTQLLRSAVDPSCIAAMAASGFAGGLLRFGLMNRASGLLFRGGVEAAAFGAESMAFTSTALATDRLLDRDHPSSFGADLASGSLFLGALKVGGWMARPLERSLGRSFASAAGTFGGVFAAHGAEELLDLREARDGSHRLLEALAGTAHVYIGGYLANRALSSFPGLRGPLLSEEIPAPRPNPSRWRAFALDMVMAPLGLIMGANSFSRPGTTRVAGPKRAERRQAWEVELSKAMADLLPFGSVRENVNHSRVSLLNTSNRSSIYSTARTMLNSTETRPDSQIFIFRDHQTRSEQRSIHLTLETLLQQNLRNNPTPPDFTIGLLFPSARKVSIFESDGRYSEYEALKNVLDLASSQASGPQAAAPAPAPMPVAARVPAPHPAAARPASRPVDSSTIPHDLLQRLLESQNQAYARFENARAAETQRQAVGEGQLQGIRQLANSQAQVEYFDRLNGVSVPNIPGDTPMAKISGFFGDQLNQVRRVFTERWGQARTSFLVSVGADDPKISDADWTQMMREALREMDSQSRVPQNAQFTLVLVQRRPRAITFTRKGTSFREEQTGAFQSRQAADPRRAAAPGAAPIPTRLAEPPNVAEIPAYQTIQGLFDAFSRAAPENQEIRVRYTGLWSDARQHSVIEWIERSMRDTPNRHFKIYLSNPQREIDLVWNGVTCVSYR